MEGTRLWLGNVYIGWVRRNSTKNVITLESERFPTKANALRETSRKLLLLLLLLPPASVSAQEDRAGWSRGTGTAFHVAGYALQSGQAPDTFSFPTCFKIQTSFFFFLVISHPEEEELPQFSEGSLQYRRCSTRGHNQQFELCLR